MQSQPNGADDAGATTVEIPRTFDEWVQTLTRVERRLCSGCLDRVAIASDGANDYCESCLRYQYGADQIEEKTVRSIVGAAVAAALDVGASEALVRLAVEDAFAERVEVKTRWRV